MTTRVRASDRWLVGDLGRGKRWSNLLIADVLRRVALVLLDDWGDVSCEVAEENCSDSAKRQSVVLYCAHVHPSAAPLHVALHQAGVYDDPRVKSNTIIITLKGCALALLV